MENLNVRYKLWLETTDGESIFGDGKWELLKLIKEEGSLMSAVEKKGYSYRKTWNKLKEIEKKLGFEIVDKKRGGSRGGSTTLTPKGNELVVFFEQLHEGLDAYMTNLEISVKSKLKPNPRCK